MRAIIALPGYARRVARLLTPVERLAMETAIAADPVTYPVIPGTGGFRKARWARGNKGKSGGVRAIFYYFVTAEAVYILDIYAKNEQENISNAEKNKLRRIAQEIERSANGGS